MRLQSKCRLRLQSREALTEDGGSPSKMAHSNGCCQEASVLAIGTSLYDMEDDFPQSKRERNSKEETPMTFMTYSLFYFHHILCVKKKSPCAAPIEGKRIRLHLLKGGVSRNLQTYFKIITLSCRIEWELHEIKITKCLEQDLSSTYLESPSLWMRKDRLIVRLKALAWKIALKK